jgi:hypothetical protein
MEAQPETTSRAPPSHSRELQWGWFVVLLANLPVPLFFGFLVTSMAGAFGMIAGLVVVWLIGHGFVARVSAVREPLMVGGAFVALSQLIPLVQFVAGALALHAITGRDLVRALAVDGCVAAMFADGFAVTMLTAAFLTVVALAVGFVLRAARLFDGRIARN